MEELYDEDEEKDNEEFTFKEAKDCLEDLIKDMKDWRESDQKEFQWVFKKGRDPDVLGYLCLSYDTRLKIVH